MKNEAFDYGEYEKMYADKRTVTALEEIDKAAEAIGIEYALIGGLAAYLYMKNPPEDFPDIDIQVYADSARCEVLIDALARRPKFKLGHRDYAEDEFDAVFASFIYDKWVQVDIFNDMEQLQPTKTKRVKAVELEPVEYLVIEKLVRSNASDIKMVLDLLAYMDYDKRLLSKLAAERHLTGMVSHLRYFANKHSVGKLSQRAIDSIVKRLAQD